MDGRLDQGSSKVAQPTGCPSQPHSGWAGLIKFYLVWAGLAEPEIFRAGLGWAHEIPKL